MVLRPWQGNLRLVFRLFVSCSAQPRMRLNNLKTCLRFPCLGLNTIIDSITLVLVSYVGNPVIYGKIIFLFQCLVQHWALRPVDQLLYQLMGQPAQQHIPALKDIILWEKLLGLVDKMACGTAPMWFVVCWLMPVSLVTYYACYFTYIHVFINHPSMTFWCSFICYCILLEKKSFGLSFII